MWRNNIEINVSIDYAINFMNRNIKSWIVVEKYLKICPSDTFVITKIWTTQYVSYFNMKYCQIKMAGAWKHNHLMGQDSHYCSEEGKCSSFQQQSSWLPAPSIYARMKWALLSWIYFPYSLLDWKIHLVLKKGVLHYAKANEALPTFMSLPISWLLLLDRMYR